MANAINRRADPAATWASENPVLADRQPGHESDTGRVKFGDGVTAWNDLPYRYVPPTSGSGAPASTPVIIGQVYVDEDTDTHYMSSGTVDANDWDALGSGSGTGDMLAANNLSDVASAATARSNLSVYSAAEVDSAIDVDVAVGVAAAAADATSKANAAQSAAEATAAADATTKANAAQSAAEATAAADATSKAAAAQAAAVQRANHTGAQAASTISDFDTQVRTSAVSQLAEDPPDIISGTTHTLVAANHGHVLRATNASAVTVTVPTDASDDLPDGFWCVVFSEGAGGVTSTVTGITTPGAPNTSIAQGEGILYMKTAAANTWLIMGGTAA